jgi:energy-coupling factor transporter ATP-binding protein EcfA2
MNKLPLFIVTGASGSGKSTVLPKLQRLMPDFIMFDMDYMMGHDWETRGTNWLLVARAITNGGHYCVLFGNATPVDFTSLKYYANTNFSHIHYLILHCDNDTRAERLHKREWCDEWINYSLNLSQILLDYSTSTTPHLPVIDTSNNPPIRDVAIQIRNWILSRT